MIVGKKESGKQDDTTKKPKAGRVYLDQSDCGNNEIYIGTHDGDLVCLKTGRFYSNGAGFDGDADDFKDVTDLVFVDISAMEDFE